MNCECGQSMMSVYRNHYDSYIDHWWCCECGRMCLQDEDYIKWLVPEKCKTIPLKGNVGAWEVKKK